MHECMICRKEIAADDAVIHASTDAGEARAHKRCATLLAALIASTGEPNVVQPSIRKAPVLQKLGDDWMVMSRDVSVNTIILSYLDVQSTPVDVRDLYKWLERNEIRVTNPSDRVGKMKTYNHVTILRQGGIRTICITDAGRDALRKAHDTTSASG